MLSKRLLGGLLYTAILVGGMLLRYVHVRFFDVVIMFFTIVAAIEMANALKTKYTPPNIGFILFAIVLGYIGYLFFGLYMFFTGIVITIAVMFLFMIFDKTITLPTLTSTVLAIIYPVTLFAFLLQLNTMSDAGKFLTVTLKPANLTTGLFALMLAFGVSNFSDIFAYIFGVTIGTKFNHKLCPSISPKKTVEGALGGLFGGVVASMLIFILCYFGVLGLFLFPVPLWTNVLLCILLGLVGSFFTQCGDLVASIIKRNCEIKDFGKIILGHGGIMDRVDGVLFNSIFIYIFMTIFNMIITFL